MGQTLLCCNEQKLEPPIIERVNCQLLALRKRLGQSMCQVEVFEYCEKEKLVHLQSLSNRYYSQFAQRLVGPVTIFRQKGVALRENAPHLRLLEVSAKGYAWRDFPVSELAEDP